MDLSVREFFAPLAVIFTVAAYCPYLLAVLKGEAKPTLSCWISGLALQGAIWLGMYLQNEVAPQIYAYISGIAVILLASLWKQASMNWTQLDSFCCCLVVAAIGVWQLLSNPNIIIVLTLAAMLVSFWPMVRNVWKDPLIEPPGSWAIMWVGGLFGLLAVSEWTIVGSAMQIVIFALQTAILFLLRKPLSTLLQKLREKIWRKNAPA